MQNQEEPLIKDFKSAIIISPPIELSIQIQQYRKKYDKAFVRWMPHINLIFPFVKINDFNSVYDLLRKELSDFPAFKLVFKEVSFFQHGNNYVVWLKPETPEDPTIINRLQAKLESLLPGFNELSNKSPAGFQPHLTLGQFNGKKEAEQKIASIQADLQPIEFEVSEIFMINRNGDVPFSIENTIRLSRKL
ncbi:hypothetical protein RB653_006081 [Dictyostelium firmibasis]|uniref:2'-5' RNA ligase n=1 Tax=Dictyostelium firmibasis TaxID=79012 RepID=A0AAN7U2D5_9MYCE